MLGGSLPERSLVKPISRAGHALDTVAINGMLEAPLSDRGHDSDLRLFARGVRGDRLGEPYDTNGVRDE